MRMRQKMLGNINKAHRAQVQFRPSLRSHTRRGEKRQEVEIDSYVSEWEHVGNKPYGNEPEFGTPIYY